MALLFSHTSAVAAEDDIRRGTNATIANRSKDSPPTLPSFHSILDAELECQLLSLGYKRWTDHSFESDPPFILAPLGSGSWCPRKVVNVHDPLFPAVGVGIFPLERVRQSIQLRWLEGHEKNSAEQDFVLWFLRLQRYLPQNISLLDPLLYPGASAAGFRRRVWALFSLMGSHIQLPGTGLVFLVMVDVRYDSYSVTLSLGDASTSRITRTLPLPQALLSEDMTFREWLDTVPPRTSSYQHWLEYLIEETERTSSSIPNLGATTTQQQGFFETPRVLTTTPPPRSFEMKQAVDVGSEVGSTSVRAHGQRKTSSIVDGLGFEELFLGRLHNTYLKFEILDWKTQVFGGRKPPFVLASYPGSDLLYPRLRLTATDPLVRTLGTGILGLEIACLMIRRQGDSTSAALSFLSWFDCLHRQQYLGDHITLIDNSIYPDAGKPGVESFRRKVWALLSMIGRQVIIPTVTVDCVRILMIQPDYDNFKISLHVSGPGGWRECVPFPCDLRADNPDTWLKTMDVNQYSRNIAYRSRILESKNLSREVQIDLQFCFYFANHVFDHAQVHEILQSRYPTDFPFTESDIETLYYQLLVQAAYENNIEWREWARALGSDEKGRRMVTLIADWHCRTAERSSR